MTENDSAQAQEIANQLNVIYDTELTNKLVQSLRSDALLADVLLLCVECREPIKARINTQQWIRVEWIGPDGQCLKCHQAAKGSQSLNNMEKEGDTK